MEKQEINDSTRGPYPGLRTTTNVAAAGKSHHKHYSRYHPFQHNPAATAAHSVASQAGPGCKAGSSSYHQPPSRLSRTTHASAGVGGISNTVSRDIIPGSGWAARSSSYQTPPSPLLQTHSSGGNIGGVVAGVSAAGDTSKGALSVSSWCQMPPPPSPAPVAMDTNPTLGGGHATFVSSPDTGLASVVGLAPLTCTQPPLSRSVDQASSESALLAPLLTQSTASVDFGLTQEYVLPHLSSILSGPPPMQTATVVDLKAVQSSGRDRGSTSTSTKAPCPSLPKPYSSGYTCITQAPWTPLPALTSSSSMPAPVANFGVKKGAVDWSLGTSQLGKNNITSGGSSSAWMPQPYSSGSTDKLPSPPLVADFADGLFTQNDIDKIMQAKDLADIVLKDPKKVRSLLNNRRASERSRQKKIERLAELEHLVELLQEENKSLSARMHSLQNETIGLTAENNEMIIKLYAFQQETQLTNALNEIQNAEVRRLKPCVAEIGSSRVSNSSYQKRSPQMIQPEHPKKHNHQLAQLQQDQEWQEFENFITQ